MTRPLFLAAGPAAQSHSVGKSGWRAKANRVSSWAAVMRSAERGRAAISCRCTQRASRVSGVSANHEFEAYEIEMAVPLSPQEVIRKRNAIYKHQSQKDRPVFPGDDAREFWMRAEDRNRETARWYNQLGLAEYEAMEAFVKHPF